MTTFSLVLSFFDCFSKTWSWKIFKYIYLYYVSTIFLLYFYYISIYTTTFKYIYIYTFLFNLLCWDSVWVSQYNIRFLGSSKVTIHNQTNLHYYNLFRGKVNWSQSGIWRAGSSHPANYCMAFQHHRNACLCESSNSVVRIWETNSGNLNWWSKNPNHS